VQAAAVVDARVRVAESRAGEIDDPDVLQEAVVDQASSDACRLLAGLGECLGGPASTESLGEMFEDDLKSSSQLLSRLYALGAAPASMSTNPLGVEHRAVGGRAGIGAIAGAAFLEGTSVPVLAVVGRTRQRCGRDSALGGADDGGEGVRVLAFRTSCACANGFASQTHKRGARSSPAATHPRREDSVSDAPLAEARCLGYPCILQPLHLSSLILQLTVCGATESNQVMGT